MFKFLFFLVLIYVLYRIIKKRAKHSYRHYSSSSAHDSHPHYGHNHYRRHHKSRSFFSS